MYIPRLYLSRLELVRVLLCLSRGNQVCSRARRRHMRATVRTEFRQGHERLCAAHGKSKVCDFMVPSRNPRMQWAEEMVVRVQAVDISVLIVGEVGTGRQLFARWLHEISARRDQRMVRLNCSGARPETLHRALRKLQEVKGGVLFLHEIADLDPLLQLKVLALLQEEESSMDPGARQDKTNFRLIASTARLEEMTLPEKHFRPELYYRLSSILIRLPPLRERKEDIPSLVEFFQRKYSAAFQVDHLEPLGDADLRVLHEYDWPGNVRELENLIKRVVLFGPAGLDRKEFWPRTGARRAPAEVPMVLDSGAIPSLKETARAAAQLAERELIVIALNRTRWNRRQTARELQVSYKTLLYKLKQLGLGKDNSGGAEEGKKRAHSPSFSNQTEKGYA